MNVQNRVGKRVEERRAHQPHESRKADEPDAPAQELLRNGAVELVTRRETSMVDDQRLDTCAGRTAQSSGARPIRDHDRDAGIELTIRHGVYERL
jgi:hypothetical protein